MMKYVTYNFIRNKFVSLFWFQSTTIGVEEGLKKIWIKPLHILLIWFEILIKFHHLMLLLASCPIFDVKANRLVKCNWIVPLIKIIIRKVSHFRFETWFRKILIAITRCTLTHDDKLIMYFIIVFYCWMGSFFLKLI